MHEPQQIILNDEKQIIENLEAFTRLYGYIMYFHPSDEASEIDWDTFSVYGISKVINAKDSMELKDILIELFTPIAPTIQIYYDNEIPNHLEVEQFNSVGLVAWQHFGLGINNHEGYQSKRVFSDSSSDILLFDKTLPANESIIKKLNSNLNSFIPLVLFRDDNGTLGSTKESEKRFEKIKNKLASFDYDDKLKYFADISIIWNVFQHFYPYFDVVNVDWEHELRKALLSTLHAEDENEFRDIIDSMLVSLSDGHISAVTSPKSNYLPFQVDWIEKQLVVTVTNSNDMFKLGDIIVEINGEQSSQYLKNIESRISGSSQWKRYKSLRDFIVSDSAETELSLKISRNSEEIELISVKYDSYLSDEFNRTETIYEIEDNIYYVNQTQLTNYILEENLDKLSKANGIIFDLRGYPEDFEAAKIVIAHLTDKTVQSPIIQVPKIIYPDQDNIEFETIQWDIEPKVPKFQGNIVFITYSGAISRPELFLDIINYYGLGDIIGQVTAGANGGVNNIILIDHEEIYWTGSKVLKHDGTQHHLIGIKPSFIVERTIEAVKQGKDEYILESLALIKKSY